jgi:hypothetical protein
MDLPDAPFGNSAALPILANANKLAATSKEEVDLIELIWYLRKKLFNNISKCCAK